MSSQRKIRENRLNAQSSTGPKTPHGKAASSQNATTHGLTARHLLLSIEDRAALELLRADLIHEYRPQGVQELLLVTQIADSFWRLQRAKLIETALFERELCRESANDSQTVLSAWECKKHDLDLLRRYTKGFESAYFRAITLLRQIQKDRKRSDPPKLGFVSNPNQIKEIRGNPCPSVAKSSGEPATKSSPPPPLDIKSA